MAPPYTPPAATGPVSLTFQVSFSSRFPLPLCFLFHEEHNSEFLSLYNDIYFCLCYWQALCQCDNTLSQFLKTARVRGIRKQRWQHLQQMWSWQSFNQAASRLGTSTQIQQYANQLTKVSYPLFFFNEMVDQQNHFALEVFCPQTILLNVNCMVPVTWRNKKAKL